MKTLNLALIAALTLTTASALATSTGTNRSITFNQGASNSTTTFYDYTRGNGIAKSYQEIDGGGYTTRDEAYRVRDFINGESTAVSLTGSTVTSNGVNVGALSLSASYNAGSVTTYIEGYSNERKYTAGNYIESSVANNGRDVFNESGKFSRGSRTHKTNTNTQVTNYNSNYNNVDFDY